MAQAGGPGFLEVTHMKAMSMSTSLLPPRQGYTAQHIKQSSSGLIDHHRARHKGWCWCSVFGALHTVMILGNLPAGRVRVGAFADLPRSGGCVW